MSNFDIRRAEELFEWGIIQELKLNDDFHAAYETESCFRLLMYYIWNELRILLHSASQ